jgi:hypothetical protein
MSESRALGPGHSQDNSRSNAVVRRRVETAGCDCSVQDFGCLDGIGTVFHEKGPKGDGETSN